MRLIYHLYLPPCHKCFVCLMSPLNRLSLGEKRKKKKPCVFLQQYTGANLETGIGQGAGNPKISKTLLEFAMSNTAPEMNQIGVEKELNKQTNKKTSMETQGDPESLGSVVFIRLKSLREKPQAPELIMCIGYSWMKKQGRHRQQRGELGYYI